MMKTTHKRVVVVGSVGFDHIMNLPGTFSEWIMPDKIHRLNVSFTVGSLRKEFGGTGGNCAYSLGLLGLKPYLVGILGNDARLYREHLKAAGVFTDYLTTKPEILSASGQVMTDMDDNQIWSYYPGPLVGMKAIALDKIVRPGDLVALLPSEPVAFGVHLEQMVSRGVEFLFDPAFFIPNLSKEQLMRGITQARIVIGNDYEIALMERKTGTKKSWWLKNPKTIVVETLGPQGSVVRRGQETWQIPAVPVKKVVDPTGAGDAYRAGFLAGYMTGKGLGDCGWWGATVAAKTVERYGTQTHQLSGVGFWKNL